MYCHPVTLISKRIITNQVIITVMYDWLMTEPVMPVVLSLFGRDYCGGFACKDEYNAANRCVVWDCIFYCTYSSTTLKSYE